MDRIRKNFTYLSDTPDTLANHPGELVRVNATADGLEYFLKPGDDMVDAVDLVGAKI